MMIDIIGLSGKAGSGKDFLSQTYLVPQGYYRFSLAWHFKVWLIGKGEASYEEVFFTKPPNVRKMLQLEGTEYGRMKYGEDVWCNTMLTWMRVLAEHNNITKFVVPDVRFPNEVECIKNAGGKVFRVEAPIRVQKSSLTEEARHHISETALDTYTDFDGIIQNDPYFENAILPQINNLLGIRLNNV